MRFAEPEPWVVQALRQGMVIPAHPLALDASRRLDRDRQRGLARYYHAAGAGGIAVGVHTTQFSIRDPQHDLLAPVLDIAAETIRACDAATARQSVLIAGICGVTTQAIREARLAVQHGYHAGLLSMAALRTESEDALVQHAESVSREIPLIGFYLQPSVGGRVLSFEFWKRFVEIPNVIAIKVAPFNRYQTLDVLRAVAESGRRDEIALYTGNDDNIVVDLVTEFEISTPSGVVPLRFVGGLLGHWACWTHAAVAIWKRCREEAASGTISAELLSIAQQVTETNAAIFDAAHQYAGCIAGIHEALRLDGIVDCIHCLDPREQLSPGQAALIEQVRRRYPELTC